MASLINSAQGQSNRKTIEDNNNNKCFSIAQILQTVINALYSLDIYITIYLLKAEEVSF